MKKCLILLVILGLVLGSVSAEDLGLFSDIDYAELSEAEYEVTDGGIITPAVAVAVSVGVGAASSVAGYVVTTKLTGGKVTTEGIVGSAIVGGASGFLNSAGTIGKALIGITEPFIKSVITSAATGLGSGIVGGTIQGAIDGKLAGATR